MTTANAVFEGGGIDELVKMLLTGTSDLLPPENDSAINLVCTLAIAAMAVCSTIVIIIATIALVDHARRKKGYQVAIERYK